LNPFYGTVFTVLFFAVLFFAVLFFAVLFFQANCSEPIEFPK
jgi:hypothetical protein